MIRYITQRLFNLLPTFIIATLLAWLVVDLAPGDFADQFELDQIDPSKAERIRQQLGLDQPSLLRYVKWFANLIGVNLDLHGYNFRLYQQHYYQWQGFGSFLGMMSNFLFLFEQLFIVIINIFQTLWYFFVVLYLLLSQFVVALFQGTLEFSLGTSLASRNEAWILIAPRMLNSLWMALPAAILMYLLAIPIGIYSALHKYSIGDRVLTVFSLLGLAIPNFFFALICMALVVQVFSQNGCFILPIGGMSSYDLADLNLCGFQEVDFGDFVWGRAFDRMWHLIAPVTIVTLSSLAGLTRVMRGQMLETLGKDYIRTARAKGLKERSITYKHALRNAILVIIATIGDIIPYLLLGSGSVEFVMRWPGLTPLFIDSVRAHDTYVLMAILTVGVLLVMLGNIISDIAIALIDPRVRY